jgi:hypothetical protein
LIESIQSIDEPGKPLFIPSSELAKDGICLYPTRIRGRRRDLVKLHSIRLCRAKDLHFAAPSKAVKRLGKEAGCFAKHGKGLIDDDGCIPDLT